MSLADNYEIVVVTADGENWKKEKVSVAGVRRMLSEWISPSYKEKMLRLRDVDESIREWAKILKTTVRELKKAFKAGRIVDVAILFARLNKNMKMLVEVGDGVKEIYEEALAEFEGEHELTDYDILKEFDKKKESAFWSDVARKYIGSKFYGKEIRERNLAIRRLVAKAEHTYKVVESYLDEMRSAKNKGDIGKYVDMLKNISDKQKEFETSFVPVYDKYLKRSVDRIIKKREDEVARDAEKITLEQKPTEVPYVDVQEDSRLGQRAEEVPYMAPPEPQPLTGTPYANTVEQMAFPYEGEPEVTIESTPPTPRTIRPPQRLETELEEALTESSAPPTKKEPWTEEDIEKIPPTQRSGQITSGLEMDEITKLAHEEFIKGLASINEPRQMAIALLKYAELIEDEDLDTSLKLMAIVEGII